jgi:hypothetical protein
MRGFGEHERRSRRRSLDRSEERWNAFGQRWTERVS